MRIVNWKGLNVLLGNIPRRRPGVYGFWHLVTNRWYIGVSKNLASRLVEYADASSVSTGRRFKFALQMYGIEAFVCFPLFYQEVYERSELLKIETTFIRIFDAVRNGFNIIENTHPGYGYGDEFISICKEIHQKDEVRKIHSNAAKLTWSDPEYKLERIKKNIEVWNRPENAAARAESLLRIRSSKEITEKKSKSVSKFYIANPYRYITNGSTNKKLFGRQDVPEGWHYGITYKTKPTGRPKRKIL